MGTTSSQENADTELLPQLPAATTWSFYKCASEQLSKPKDKSQNLPMKIVEDGRKFYRWEIPENSKKRKRVREILDGVQGTSLKIDKVVAVYNPELVQSFITQQAVFESRFTENPEIFKKQDWKKTTNKSVKETREQVFKQFEKFVDSFEWNKEAKVPIIPCVSGYCNENEATKVVKFGFDSFDASATQGQFGQGIYVTTSPLTSSNTIKTLLISYTIPGNVFPVIHGDTNNNNENSKLKPLVGRPVKSGYNSHFVLVNPVDSSVPEDVNNDNLIGELVVGQQSQLIPAFIVHLKDTEP